MTEDNLPSPSCVASPKSLDETVVLSPTSVSGSEDSYGPCSCTTCRDLECQKTTGDSVCKAGFLERVRNLDVRPKLPFWISRFLGYRPDGIHRPIWALRWLDTFGVPLALEECVASVFSTVFGMITVIMINTMTSFSSLSIPLSMGYVGALSIMMNLAPLSPAATPRNVLISHLFSSVLATSIAKIFMDDSHVEIRDQMSNQQVWIWACVSVTITMLFQKTFNLFHPPAGGTALMGVVQPNLIRIGWAYVGFVMSGTAALVGVALVWGNVGRRSYPAFWFTPSTPPKCAAPSRSASSRETETHFLYASDQTSNGINYQSSKSSKENISIHSSTDLGEKNLSPSIHSSHQINPPLSLHPSSKSSLSIKSS